MKSFRVLLVVSIFFTASFAALEGFVWKTGDSITRAHIETKWLLRSQMLFGRNTAVCDWLMKYHGEAPGMEVMNVFTRWAISHPERAEAILSNRSVHDEDRLAKRMAFAVSDSGIAAKFTSAFAGTSSAFMQAVLRQVKIYTERKQQMTPNDALQQTFDPSALFAAAKNTAASNATELWR